MQAASNIAASAKAGMEKTKAVVQEKAEKMTTSDPIQKQIAEEKKQVKIHEAEQMKMQTRAQNEAAKHTTTGLGGLTHGTHGTHGTTGTGLTHGTHGTHGTTGTGLTHGTHGTTGTGLHDPTHGHTTGTGHTTGHTGIGGLLGKATGHTTDPRV